MHMLISTCYLTSLVGSSCLILLIPLFTPSWRFPSPLVSRLRSLLSIKLLGLLQQVSSFYLLLDAGATWRGCLHCLSSLSTWMPWQPHPHHGWHSRSCLLTTSSCLQPKPSLKPWHPTVYWTFLLRPTDTSNLINTAKTGLPFSPKLASLFSYISFSD